MQGVPVRDTTENWRVIYCSNYNPARMLRLEQFLQQRGHRLTGILTSPGPRSRRNTTYLDLVAAVHPGLDVIVSNHPGRWAEMLSTMRPDLIICGGFPWIMPEAVLRLPWLGVINFHNSLLPKYRGPNAFGWAFRNDDGVIGATIHRMSSELDRGAILAQGTVPYTDDDDIDTILPRFADLLFQLLPDVFARLAAGDPGDPQDESQASRADLFEEAWRTIDWSSPARLIHNQVRSWVGIQDHPRGAIGDIDGTRTRIIKSRLTLDDQTGSGPSGSILRRDKETILIQCGDVPLVIEEYELE